MPSYFRRTTTVAPRPALQEKMRFALVVALSSLASTAYASHALCIMAKKGYGTKFDLFTHDHPQGQYTNPNVPPYQLNLSGPWDLQMTVKIGNDLKGQFRATSYGTKWNGGNWYNLKKTGPTSNGHTYWWGCWAGPEAPNFCNELTFQCTNQEFILFPTK